MFVLPSKLGVINYLKLKKLLKNIKERVKFVVGSLGRGFTLTFHDNVIYSK